MSAETDLIPRSRLTEERLTEHMKHDDLRFATLDRRLERIEMDVRSLLEWRWKLVGALGVLIFAATWFVDWVR